MAGIAVAEHSIHLPSSRSYWSRLPIKDAIFNNKRVPANFPELLIYYKPQQSQLHQTDRTLLNENIGPAFCKFCRLPEKLLEVLFHRLLQN